MSRWIGYLVSIKCVDNIGTYQGEIVAATNTVISLGKAFCNGIPCPNQNEPVKIRAQDIVDLKLIDRQSLSPQQSSTITIAKPIAKKVIQRCHIPSESIKIANSGSTHAKSKPIDIEQKSTITENLAKTGTPNKKERNTKTKWTRGWRDEECFGSPSVDEISQDFDFEKNLALFNKQAIWDQLNSNYQKPDILKQVETRKPTKYRHDENIIASGPVIYRQIEVPKQDVCEYVTDDGLVIPCINSSLRSKLFECAEKAGITWERRVELIGRAVTEISIQLLGGGHRLNPHNSHQRPTVVILCGPNRQGAMGINAARQLCSHGVHTIIYWIPTMNKDIEKELFLYQLTKCPVVTNVDELPAISDLIILALSDDPENSKYYSDLSTWTNRNKAPVLALDPPSCGMNNFHPKFSLIPVLPLPHSPVNVI